ncbi:MAG: hypothetical protein HQL60_06065, partial [Magnetococcales bacterium]|nr:hypothetical protein [Magnetococcales bacterium]
MAETTLKGVTMDDEKRNVIAILDKATSKPGGGYLKPLAEFIGGAWRPTTKENFCKSGIIFVTTGYPELEHKYKGRLFHISCTPNLQSPSGDPGLANRASYIAKLSSAKAPTATEIIQIIPADLPDPNVRQLIVESLPITDKVMVLDKEKIFGPFDWKEED